ncbi:hypothetical protein [Mucilaginibacter sp.]|uniref:hypothetical protein n=1 Tax=Mucilaginibacter sp. TaxID=1882438 RepID=UPI000CB1EC8A|nr:hypothetical protein [Mucilaginibacter sp.]PLW89628.1 MAG: hypothetical protein C0154_10560 [Mucilaginibacter sp.]HEK19771.1 hypothetical protein [Bacteroidota bacterium]
MISTNQLIEELKRINPEGLQVSTKVGLLNSTKAVYFKDNKFYIFRIEDAFSFNKSNGYTEKELTEKYGNYIWRIEEVIS